MAYVLHRKLVQCLEIALCEWLYAAAEVISGDTFYSAEKRCSCSRKKEKEVPVLYVVRVLQSTVPDPW